MSESKANPILKYLITSGICLLIAVVYFFSNIPVYAILETPMLEIARVLSDACMIPGMLTLMLGLLFWVASEGALDGVTYLGSYLVKTLTPGKRSSIERYGDYVMRKRSGRKTGFGFLCIVGVIFVVLSLAFLGLFYVYY